MPRGRSTFTKRQKEQARQQKQKDKLSRKAQRSEEKPAGEVDEMAELLAHAEEQKALFSVGVDDAEPEDLEPTQGPAEAQR